MVAAKTATTKKTATKTSKKSVTQTETAESKLGSIIMVYTKSSSHWYGMVEPEVVTIADTKFVRGKQITGKEGHRMEGKITLVPLEHVASIIEFESEDELWNESQPRNLPLPIDESRQSAVLTSHENLQAVPKKHLTKPPKGFSSHFSNKFKGRQPRFSNDF